MSWKEERKAVVKIVWYLLLFLIYLHVTACIFFYIVCYSHDYIPPLNYFVGNYKERFEDTNFSHQYLVMLYYMIALIGGNELGPNSTLECIYLTILMVTAALITASLFGEMFVLISSI